MKTPPMYQPPLLSLMVERIVPLILGSAVLGNPLELSIPEPEPVIGPTALKSPP